MRVSGMIAPCLWFDDEAEPAARFYTSIFPNSKIGDIARYGEVGKEFHGKEPGSVMTVEFEINGQPFTGLNGGPVFQFSEAISFQVHCETQSEVDYFWDKLGDGGEIQQCGWLKDKFGVSWQIVPNALLRLMKDPDPVRSQRTLQAMFQMKKFDIAALEKAHAG